MCQYRGVRSDGTVWDNALVGGDPLLAQVLFHLVVSESGDVVAKTLAVGTWRPLSRALGIAVQSVNARLVNY